jgi:hypothetical protein
LLAVAEEALILTIRVLAVLVVEVLEEIKIALVKHLELLILAAEVEVLLVVLALQAVQVLLSSV